VTAPTRCDVLISGLGPVGAALAALLVREGLSVIAVEKETEVYPLPRAAHFDHEIMRLFQRLGIAETVLADARIAPAYEFRNAAGDILMRYDLVA
jgi:3-(3-hydroxy-phenyl)propionate hydroxylase